MMYALGDMDGIICLAGALCKTWALLFTGEFVSQHSRSAPCTGLTHVRRGVWGVRADLPEGCNDLPTCAEKFGSPSVPSLQLSL